MTHSRIYKKYYPVTLVSLQTMDKRILTQISSWLERIEQEIRIFNMNRCYKNLKRGYFLFEEDIVWNFDDPIRIALKLKKQRFFDLKEEDINAINFVVFRNQFNWFRSKFVFPIERSIENTSLGTAQIKKETVEMNKKNKGE